MQIEARKNNVNFTSIMPLVVIKDGERVVREEEIFKAVSLLTEPLKSQKRDLAWINNIQELFRTHDKAFCGPQGQYIRVNPKAKGLPQKNTICGVLHDGVMYLATGKQANDLNHYFSKIGRIKREILKSKESSTSLWNNYYALVGNLKKTLAEYIENCPKLRVTEGINPKTNVIEGFDPKSRETIGAPAELVINLKTHNPGRANSALTIDNASFEQQGTNPFITIIPKERGFSAQGMFQARRLQEQLIVSPKVVEQTSTKTPIETPNLKNRKKSSKSSSEQGQLNLEF